MRLAAFGMPGILTVGRPELACYVSRLIADRACCNNFLQGVANNLGKQLSEADCMHTGRLTRFHPGSTRNRSLHLRPSNCGFSISLIEQPSAPMRVPPGEHAHRCIGRRSAARRTDLVSADGEDQRQRAELVLGAQQARSSGPSAFRASATRARAAGCGSALPRTDSLTSESRCGLRAESRNSRRLSRSRPSTAT